MKRKDIWILLAILALAFLCYLFFGRPVGQTPQGIPMLRITVAGRETGLVALDHSENLTLAGENDAYNVVKIFPGGFSMKESNVTMHLLRTRKKLERFLRKEGFYL